MKNFFQFVEISTKLASLIPFLVGLGYSRYHYGSIHRGKTLLFMVSMLLFDMSTTAVNNHIDARKSGKEPHYGANTSMGIILFMLLTAAILGLYLAWATSIIVLVCGVFCFLIGILYTYGPAPISRTPYGELFSGAVMGFFIPFLTVFINHPVDLIFVTYLYPILNININTVEILSIALLTLPLIFAIAAIMLANNICDLDKDIKVHRYTLPFHMGKTKSIQLFGFLYVLAYGFIIVIVFSGVMPLYGLCCLLTSPLVYANIRRFMEKQDKKETFPLSIMNFLLVSLPMAAIYFIGSIVAGIYER